MPAAPRKRFMGKVTCSPKWRSDSTLPRRMQDKSCIDCHERIAHSGS